MVRFVIAIDLEWTTQGAVASKEIIEFAAIAYDLNRKIILDEFHAYVKPFDCSKFTSFCSSFTGISKSTIEKSPHLPRVMAGFDEWIHQLGRYNIQLRSSGRPGNGCVITWSGHDIKMLKYNLNVLPDTLRHTVDLQRVFKARYPKSNFGLHNALKQFNVRPDGVKHSAKFDAINLATLSGCMGAGAIPA